MRLGLVGLSRGSIFFEYKKHFEVDFEVTAICDSDKIHNRFRIPFFENYTDLLSSGLIDLIYVATPPDTHLEISRLALSLNIHVICEVPGVRNVDEWKLLVAAEKQSLASFFLAENYLFAPDNWSIIKLVNDDFFGEITQIKTKYIHDCYDLGFKSDGSLTWRGELRLRRHGNDYPCHTFYPALAILASQKPAGKPAPRFTLSSINGPCSRLLEGNNKNSVLDSATSLRLLHSDFNFTFLVSESGPLIHMEYDILSNRLHNVVSTSLCGTKGGVIGGRLDMEKSILYETSETSYEFSDSPINSHRPKISDKDLLTLAGYPVSRLKSTQWKTPFILCVENIFRAIEAGTNSNELKFLYFSARVIEQSNMSAIANGQPLEFGPVDFDVPIDKLCV